MPRNPPLPVALKVSMIEADALLDAIVLTNHHEQSAGRRQRYASLFARVKLARDDAQRELDAQAFVGREIAERRAERASS